MRLGLQGMPAETESICAGRDMQLAELTVPPAHRHISTTAALNTCAARKNRACASPAKSRHHFTLCDEDVRYDTNYKMNPPLASRADVSALIVGIADGNVDAIATDHARIIQQAKTSNSIAPPSASSDSKLR